MSLIKECIARVRASGDTSPGQWNLVADILFLAAAETSRWDDAARIPDMLSETEERLRQEASGAASEVQDE